MRPRRPPISACVLARDEAHALPACIASLRPHVAEIVVVDTGSSDGTSHVAAELGARVVSFDWVDDFGAARNFAASSASQPFVLMIDADEHLASDSVAALLAYCGTARGAGRVMRHNLVDADEGGTVREHLTRLHPNEAAYRWVGRIHEQLTFNGEFPPVVQTAVTLVHTGYRSEELVHADKIARNLRLLELEHQARPTDPYVQYQLGRTHFVAGNWSSALAALQSALDCLPARPAVGYFPSLLRTYAYAAIRAGDLDVAFDVLGTATDLFPDYTDLYFAYGVALLESGDPHRLGEVRDIFEGCLALGEPDPARYETVAGVGSFRARHNLGAYYEATGQLGQALAEYRQAAGVGYAPAAQRVAALTPRRAR